jgi:Cof subfamily protein (haloacid dehalogenase superfamily)
MNIKMIVTDLDKTLFRDDKTVSDYTIDIFKKCREKGIKLTFATARSSSSQIPIELFDGFVKSNGAAAFADGKKIYEKPIPIQLARQLLTAADNAGISIAAQTNERHCANFDLKKETGYLDGEIIDFSTIDFEPQKIFAIIKTKQAIEILENNLSDILYMTIARDNVAMITHKEAVKSKAVAALANNWGIRQSEIAALGDDLNDIDLLKYCGISVAMGNAVDDVKKMAKFICDTNENDGVAKWIEEYVL